MNLLKYIFKNKLLIWITIVLLVFESSCMLVVPFLGSIVIDYGIQQKGLIFTSPEYLYEPPYNNIKSILPDETSDFFSSSYTLSEKKDEYGKNYYYLNDFGKNNIYELDHIINPVLSYFNSLNIDQQRVSNLINGEEFFTDSDILRMKTEFQLYKDSKSQDEFHIDAVMLTLHNNIAFQVDIDSIQNNFYNISTIIFVSVVLIYIFSSIVSNYLSSYITYKNSKELRKKLFNKVLTFHGKEFDKFSKGSLITRSTNDIQNIQNALLLLIKNVLISPLFFIIAILGSYYIAPNLVWLIWVVFGLIIVVAAVLLIFVSGQFSHVQKIIDKINITIKDYLNGIFVIRAFNYDQKQIDKFNNFSQELYKKMVKANSFLVLANPLLVLILNLLCVVAVWFGKGLVVDYSLSVGSLTAFMFFAVQAIMSFVSTAITFILFPRAEISAKRIEEVLKCENSIEYSSKLDDKFYGKINCVEFKNVSFRYNDDDKYIIRDASFKIPSNSSNLIVGKTGSGKSTLLKLILRYYEVSEGEILINNINIKDFSKDDLYSLLSYIPQKTSVFSGTIEDNINICKNGLSKDYVYSSIEDAELSETIEGFKGGIEYKIAQKGVNISGGQKQRLNIARAFYKNSPIFIFDDLFSSIDYLTEQNIMYTINHKYNNRTMLYTTQRLGGIKDSQNIIFISECGKVVFDTHKNLIKNNEEYKKIIKG